MVLHVPAQIPLANQAVLLVTCAAIREAEVLPASTLPGVVATLAEVLKSGQPLQAARLAREQCGFVLSLSSLPGVTASSLARRLLVKLMTRMALALSPLAPAAWRRTTRIAALHATLSKPHGSSEHAADDTAGIEAGNVARSSRSSDGSQKSAAQLSSCGHDTALAWPHQAGDTEDSSAVVTIPDAVEDIIGELLQALRDADTVVRWSNPWHVEIIASRGDTATHCGPVLHGGQQVDLAASSSSCYASFTACDGH